MKTTILGGLLFLAPLVVIAIILGKAYEISLAIASPVDRFFPVERLAGVALVNIIAVVLILLFCFLAGLVARSQLVRKRVEKIDGLLIDVIPTYAVLKGMLRSMAQPEEAAGQLTPVLARFDDYEQIAFEIERDDTRAVLFLPGAPSAWSGTTVIVELSRVKRLDLPTHKAVQTLRKMGRGSIAVASLQQPSS